MIMKFKKIILLYLLLFTNFGFAQHDHNSKMNDSKNMLFSFNNSEFNAEVFSDSEKLITKKRMNLYLKLSSRLSIDSSSVSLNINSSNGKNQDLNKLMDYSSEYYKSNVLFQKSGSYKFIFSFNLKDSSGNRKKTSFSFNKDIEDTDNMTNHDHGFMGMSNAMMIVMGAAMIAMMLVAIIVGTNHK